MISGLNMANIDEYIINALKEDISSEDITTNAIIKENDILGQAQLICKEDGILAGIEVFKRVFEKIGQVNFKSNFKDGDKIKKGDVIGILIGCVKSILIGERTALNYLQRMSGIATYTNSFVKELEGTKTKLLDTRKTTPNMRIFEKYAVKVGGGYNHRYNLSDGILIKDNHIGAAGGIKKAILLAKEDASFVRKIEVEVENLEMLEEAIEAGADIIMLDNMSLQTMKKAVKIVNKRALTECSGNVSKDNLKEISKTGVDYISCGALTHSAPILDFSLKNLIII
ncbi:carboxylating nicotinate-nucleotide diphosphorylase [Clostridium tarantellae]|uniref:Probable nicotinate-nucleotide pyrophosphorylase [carboxylating] n=2 Tax=Clostridium tarantellae TaxID=39493 RepID=A0A6I1MNW0_9CLOT|nr:carboxylating nicotinate-nucleotide diphosphorylase [Clostridium tarantellae]